MANRKHTYRTQLTWDGNRGDGTSSYQSYGREYRISIDGKPELQGSADPTFRGDPAIHNPEDFFVAAVSSCHMLSYLALCARAGISVLEYRDEATADLTLEGGGGKFTEIRLHPIVKVADAAHVERAKALHEQAHALCFIANSCSAPILHEAEVSA